MMLLLPLLAIAAGPALDCENAMTQQDMNQCAAIEFRAADEKLNEQWAVTAARMKQMDADYGADYDDGRPGYFETLLAAQRAWLKYRDAHCASEGYTFRGGSMEPLVIGTCKTQLTKRRTEELRELVEYPE